MKVVYIAGKYRSKSVYGIKENIDKAEKVAIKYWKLGYAVICPHKNTAFFDGAAPDSVWLMGDLEFIRRSDVVVMMTGWKNSVGATKEHDLAIKLRKEVIYEK